MSQVELREDYRRLKDHVDTRKRRKTITFYHFLAQEMVGKQVNAELYKLPDGQVRASHVRALRQVIENAQNDDGMPALEGGDEEKAFQIT